MALSAKVATKSVNKISKDVIKTDKKRPVPLNEKKATVFKFTKSWYNVIQNPAFIANPDQSSADMF